MDILVTGGAGFLGSHIADELTTQGHCVTIYDKQPSIYLKKNQDMICGDILDENLINEALKGKNCVYHFAAISDINDCKNNPQKAISVNIIGTTKVLEGCINNNVPRIMFASSAYVFSKHGYIYKTTKIACENLIRDFSRMHGLEYTNMRYGSLYGRRSDSRNSIHRILCNALGQRKIVYYGTGEELREYIHASDAAKISAEILSEQYVNCDILISGQEKIQYKNLLGMIKEMIGDDIEIVIEDRKDDSHYCMTPYSFNAVVGSKKTLTEYIDFGQGLLDCLLDISQSSAL